MIRRLTSPAAVAAGCGLVLLVNVVILATAAWNRRGGPETVLSLTERELALPAYRQEEDSGLLLSLALAHRPPPGVWRAASRLRRELPPVEYPWLDRGKLRELGFHLAGDPADPAVADRVDQAMMRRVYLVLEYEGEAWRRWMNGREEEVRRLRREAGEGAAEPSVLTAAEELLALDRTMRSRLFPVDAGTDAAALRRRYPDRRRYAVVEGLIRPEVARPEEGAPFLRGKVAGLLVGRVHVPLKQRRHLKAYLPRETWREADRRKRHETVEGWPQPQPPRYRATLAFGRRHEPWLVEVASLAPATPGAPTSPPGE